jgi:iron complex outermembrane receptor protein
VNTLLYLQSGKNVDSFGQVALPHAMQIDIGASYQTRLGNRLVTTRVNVENLTDRAYWREAPTTSWGGQYLFANAPRNVKLSVSAEF